MAGTFGNLKDSMQHQINDLKKENTALRQELQQVHKSIDRLRFATKTDSNGIKSEIKESREALKKTTSLVQQNITTTQTKYNNIRREIKSMKTLIQQVNTTPSKLISEVTDPGVVKEPTKHTLECLLNHYVNGTDGVLQMTHYEWYQSLHSEMRLYSFKLFKNIILAKITQRTNRIQWISYKGNDLFALRVSKEIASVEMASLKEGWSHRNTKQVVILHPTNATKLLKLQPTDRQGIGWYKWERTNIPDEFYSARDELLLLCVKHLIW